MYIQYRHAQTDWPSSYWSHTDPVLVQVELLTRDNRVLGLLDCWAAAAQPEVNVSTLQLHFIPN